MWSLYVAFVLSVAWCAGPRAQPLSVVWEQAVGAQTVALSPDGRTVAAGGIQRFENDRAVGRVDLLAATDGAPLGHRETHAGDTLGVTNRVAFSPDGLALASAQGGVVCTAACASDRPGVFTWTATDLTPLASASVNMLEMPRAVVFSPMGAQVAVSSSGGGGTLLRLYDAATLAPLYGAAPDFYVTLDAAFSPDGQTLASVGSTGRLVLRDAATGVELRAVRHSTRANVMPSSVAFSPDGLWVASASRGDDARIRTWTAATLAPRLDLDGRVAEAGPGAQFTSSVAISPNGAFIVGALTQRDFDGTVRSAVRFWDAETGAVVREYDTGAPGVAAVSLSPGLARRFVVAAGDGTVRLAETDLILAAPAVGAEAGPDDAFALAVERNPSATPTLTLAVGRTQHVRVDVFTTLGRRVAVLHAGPVAVGAPVGLGLRGLPPAAYVVRVSADTFSASRVVTVVR